VTPDDVRGIAVQTAARVMGAAGPGEVLMSATVSSTRRRLRACVRGCGAP
jgi:class 3 adenylate cyclase